MSQKKSIYLSLNLKKTLFLYWLQLSLLWKVAFMININDLFDINDIKYHESIILHVSAKTLSYKFKRHLLFNSHLLAIEWTVEKIVSNNNKQTLLLFQRVGKRFKGQTINVTDRLFKQIQLLDSSLIVVFWKIENPILFHGIITIKINGNT